MSQNLEEAIDLLAATKEDILFQETKQKVDEFINHLKNSSESSLSQLHFFNESQMISKYFKQEEGPRGLKYRIYLSFPLMPFPQITCTFDNSLLRKFGLNQVENRPEAPWIKRTVEGIVFTDEVQVFQHLRLDSSVNEEPRDQQGENVGQDQDNVVEEDEQRGQQYGQGYENTEEDSPVYKAERLKELLRLDSKVEEKLKRLNNNRKQQQQQSQPTSLDVLAKAAASQNESNQ